MEPYREKWMVEALRRKDREVVSELRTEKGCISLSRLRRNSDRKIGNGIYDECRQRFAA